MTEILPGTFDLSHVELLEKVSRTNLSEVWRGRMRVSGAPVAVKFPVSPESAASLAPEAESVRHLLTCGLDGIVPAEYFAHPTPHLVMPWKGGTTFRDVLNDIRSSDDRARAMRILIRVIETTVAVHVHGLLHGDLKPENILIDAAGRPLLTDFGMARVIRRARLDSHVSCSMSAEQGAWGGTLHYLPPEGLQGEEPTAAWDVYALGVMLHEVLLSQRPDRAATPESLRSALPEEVVDLLLVALAYRPEDRIPFAGRLLDLIRPMEIGLTRTGPARWSRLLGRRARIGIAAFFVVFRYASVAALLGSYVLIALTGAFVAPAILLAFIPVLGFHWLIRWEGPETQQEAVARRSDQVFTRGGGPHP